MNTIVEEARKWIGTPYHDGARVLGVGVDCGGLLYGVATAMGVEVQDFAGTPGSDRFATLQELVESCCDLVTDEQPGDVLLFRGRGVFQHAAFDSGEGTIIHALDTRWARCVVEQRLAGIWSTIIVGRYRLKADRWPH